MAAALHAQIEFCEIQPIIEQPTNGGLVLKYFLSETIYTQENGGSGTHFAKFLISTFLKGLTSSALE